MDISLKYGCNPHQQPANLNLPDPAPLRVLNGAVGYINLLDALLAWQLARELRTATGESAAASFKHTSPAGAAIARPLTAAFRKSQFLSDEALSPIALALLRARGGDRMSSFGDMVAVSDSVDITLAKMLSREVSDGIIAPAYEPAALETLKKKKGGNYLILEMDKAYEPPEHESRQLFGLTLSQRRNTTQVSADHFKQVVTRNTEIPAGVLQTLMVATIALKYTQSNSVCLAYDGQVIGMGAGQQSRIHCTRLACDKADKWLLAQHPRVLELAFKKELRRTDKSNLVDQFLLWNELSPHERNNVLSQLKRKPMALTVEEKSEWIAGFNGICLSSDAYIPFRDNIDRAQRSRVQYVAQTGASVRDESVTAAADDYGMVMVHTGLRCFLH